ncbi:MAG: DUF1559 domain-containing protein [Aureliella sp.]
MILVCVGVFNRVIVPTLETAQEASRRTACQTNMRKIAVALLSYHDAYNSFPPPYTEDSDGNRLHSWRTLILPFTDEGFELYQTIDLGKAWDDPANQTAQGTELSLFRCPSTELAPCFTTYQAIVDPEGIFTPGALVSMVEIRDGVADTLLFSEFDPNQAVHWMQPNDRTRNDFLGLADAEVHKNGYNYATADGRVGFLMSGTDEESRISLINIASD